MLIVVACSTTPTERKLGEGSLILAHDLANNHQFTLLAASPWYIPAEDFETINTIFSFLVIFNYIIPISLYVTVGELNTDALVLRLHYGMFLAFVSRA